MRGAAHVTTGTQWTLDRNRGRTGAAGLRRVLAVHSPGSSFTRSELEERLLAAIRTAGLPEPVLNTRVLGYEVDFLWRDHRLVVETDGYAGHHSPAAFERDHRRPIELRRAGYEVRRYTWHQVVDDRRGVIADIRAALAAARRIEAGTPP